MTNSEKKQKRSLYLRIINVMLKTVLFLLVLFVALILLIQTAPVQDFIRGKAVTWLEKKLNTRVAVGRIYIDFPKDVVIENIYLEDRNRDTLFSGGKIKVDITLLKLLKNKIELNDVYFENITAIVKRELPDTTFNFQFIIDAFASKKTPDTAAKADTANNISLKKVTLNNIRLVYKDTITGNDMECHLGHFETRIDVFDLVHQRFDIPGLKIDGLTARVYQTKPLVKSEPESKDIADASTPIPLQLNFKELALEQIDVDYRNDVSAFYLNLGLQKLLVHPDKLDLPNRVIDLDDFTLQGTRAAIRLGKTPGAKVVVKETKQEIKSQAETGWKINVASLQLDSNHLRFDNDNQKRVSNGMDYAHLDADNLTLHLDNFFFTGDSVSGKITKGSLTEKSGLTLQELRADMSYGKTGAALKDFYLKTPGTELQRDLSIRYASLQSLKDHPSDTRLHLALKKSKVRLKDVLLFVPSLRSQPILANPENTLYINSSIDGLLSNLKIDELQLSGLGNTRIDLSGTLAGLPDQKHLKADLVIRSLQSTQKDLMLFIPPKSLPENLSLPDNFNITGTIRGSMTDMTAKLKLTTNLGNILVDGHAKNMTDTRLAAYQATVQTQQLAVGTILRKKDLLGTVSAVFAIQGTGTDKTTANATLNGTIQSAYVKQYNYKGLTLTGSIARQQVTLKAGIVDPNIHIALNAAADLSSTFPALQLHAVIDSIKTLPLHLTADNIIYRGNIDADFPVTNPDSLEGKLYVTRSLLVNNEQRIPIDSVQLFAGHSDSGQYVNLYSDVVNASIQGHYKITALGSIFQQAIQPYFSVSGHDSAAMPEPYDFTLRAKVINRPVLKVLIPTLQRMDSVTLVSHFTSNAGWNADLTAPVIEIGTNRISNLVINAGTKNERLEVNARVQQFTSGGSLALYNTSLAARIKDNRINFNINIKDKAAKEKYNLAGLFEQPQQGNYRFSLAPDSLLLNYERWTIAANNNIELSGNDVIARNFNLEKNNERLGINSDSGTTAAPLIVKFANFKLETLTAFIQPDSTLIGGVLNGTAEVKNVMQQPLFTSDLTIQDLNFRKDTAGNLKVLVSNTTANTYNADITITGRGNDVKLSGNYFAGQAANNFDLLLDLKHLPMTTAQAFSQGSIQDASGSVNGQFRINGNFEQPKVNGNLNFVQAVFKPTQLNNRFLIDGEKLEVNEQGIRFNQFSIRDSANNELTLNGTAATTNFTNYKFDFTVRSSNFQALNSTKKDNKLFYGQLFFNTNLHVKGTELAPAIDGRLTVNDKTKLTIVLPQKEPGVAEREGVVEFVDKDSPANDSLFLKTYDTLNTLALKGMDVAVNIEIKKEAILNLIVDEGSGDFLNVRGEALLTAGVDPSGKVTLAGSYELEDGSYQLTFNLLRRKFDIRKGSKIVWGGEPTEADVNITAAYETSTAPLDLVKNQLGPVPDAERMTYLQKLPFQVYLKMNGKLLQPVITFDVVLPEDKEYNVDPKIVSTVRTRLEMLRQDEGELNKQVFALLLLNRFVGENPFNSSGSGSTAETLIRQSASKLLTEQLNRLTENLVQGVDLNFDVESSDDYTTGKRADRTDLNVGLSKKLLNDRLTVTVGSNFELEGVQNSNRSASNIAGNVALNYRLSKDGRYMLRAYRKNEYQGVLDGYIIETGVGFIITVDYNRFREIFQKRKSRRTKKETSPSKEKTQTAAAAPTPTLNP